jgi:hypothetical protein
LGELAEIWGKSMRLNGSGVNPPRMGYFLERSRLVRNEIESLLFGVFL